MSLKKLTIDTDYFEKVLDKLSIEDLKTIYNNIMSMKYILEFNNSSLKKDYSIENKNKGKDIICPCCNKKMTNIYFYQHRKTAKYKTYISLQKKIKLLEGKFEQKKNALMKKY